MFHKTKILQHINANALMTMPLNTLLVINNIN